MIVVINVINEFMKSNNSITQYYAHTIHKITD